MDDWTSDHSFLKLESPEQILIGEVSKLLVTDSFIFILDRKRQTIYSFDQQGSFKFVIKALDNDQGEQFEYLRDIAWDQFNKQLSIVDSNANKIYIYDEKGNYLNTIKPLIRPSSIYRLTKDSWVVNNAFAGSADHPDKLYVLDNAFQKKISSQIEPDIMSGSITVPNPFITYQGQVKFIHGFDNNLYSISSNSTVKTEFSINFKSLDFSEKLKTLSRQEVMRTFMRQDYAGLVVNYLETEDYIGFTYSRNGQVDIKGSRFILFDKETSSQQVIFRKQQLGNIQISKPESFYGDRFISDIDFYSINENDEEKLEDEEMRGRSTVHGWYNNLEDIKRITKTLDSPILFYYKPKVSH
ncbi:MAG: hypothetical protein ACJAVN_001874 [Roseivirga sp.]|jgi:hypothetical protein